MLPINFSAINMLFTDKITIAIPVHERTEYFDNALESALNQTIKCNIIVVDNASSHDYFKIKCSEKGVSYFRNDKNIGMFPNWNKCFEHAVSEFVLLLGDDDYLDKSYIENFLSKLNEFPNLDIYFTNFSGNNYTINKLVAHNHIFPFGFMENGNKVLEYGAKFKLGFPMISSAVRKSAFTGYYEKFHASNDWLWIYSNAKNLCLYGEQKTLYFYGSHQNQDSKNSQTSSNCVLSLSYIYDVVLSGYFVNNKKLKRVTKTNAFLYLLNFRAITAKERIKEISENGTIYGEYLKNKLKESPVFRILYLFPRKFSSFIYLLIKNNFIVNYTNPVL